MKQTLFAISTLLIAAASFAGAGADVEAQHCIPYGDDVMLCFRDRYVVDAYSSIDTAESNFRNLAPEQKATGYLVTTADPLRRALVVYQWPAGAPQPAPQALDRYTVQLFVTMDEALARLRAMTPDQRASAILVTPKDPFHAAMLAYRTYVTCSVIASGVEQ